MKVDITSHLVLEEFGKNTEFTLKPTLIEDFGRMANLSEVWDIVGISSETLEEIHKSLANEYNVSRGNAKVLWANSKVFI